MERDTSKPDERVPWLRARRARRSFIAAALVLMVLPLAVLVWPAALGGGGDGTSTSTSSTSSRRGLQQVVNLANLFFWNLKQAGKELTKQEAAVVRIDPDRVDDAFETLEPVVEALGITGNIGAFNAAWDGFWLRKSRTCLADNVQRLEEAFRSPQCAIVLLVPGRIYHLERQILVNQSKTLVGSPAERAIVDASEAERAFLVRRGVFFDVRHILFCKCVSVGLSGEGKEKALRDGSAIQTHMLTTHTSILCCRRRGRRRVAQRVSDEIWRRDVPQRGRAAVCLRLPLHDSAGARDHLQFAARNDFRG